MSGTRFRGGAPMVRWFAPRQLITTAAKVIASSARTDYRAIEALGGWQEAFAYDGAEEMWIDYVADLGDGFSSTYAVARTLAGKLELDGVEGALEPGSVLVMGGDQVYPAAARDLYEWRMRLPYESVFPEGAAAPDLFVLPGNHDWYDGLRSFVRLFCQQRTIGALTTRQCRSYFALRLPHDWWLLALDIQLDTDVDGPQMDYFGKAAFEHMKPGDRVIVCTARPGWLEEPGSPLINNFQFIERKIGETGARVRLWMAGDLHCYMHHTEEVDGGVTHKVTAGGGGAFLHPTHGPAIEATAPLCRYPEPAVSRRLAWRNLLFFRDNLGFGVFFGALYALLGAAVAPEVAPIPLAVSRLGEVMSAGLAAIFGDPFSLLVALLIIAGSVRLAGVRRAFGWIAGGLLGLAIVATSVAVAWLSARLGAALAPWLPGALFAESVVASFVIGGLVGLVLLGTFFAVAAGVFGRVLDASFSALRVEGYKNFVRMRIGSDGSLDLWAIGLDDVPRHWRKGEGGAITPDGPEPAMPRLIEHIRVD